jgi:hypothetical protein
LHEAILVSVENFARPVAAVLRYAACALALSACTSFAAADDLGHGPADQAGSGGPASCGDVRSSAKNCGFCGHACGAGESCTEGLCPSTEVLSAPGLKGFATDGNALFYIDADTVHSCKAAGGGCVTFVTPQDVEAVALTKKAAALAPSVITMKPDRVFIADDAFRAILSCPVGERCARESLGIVDDEGSDGQPIRGLTAGPIGLAWTRGDLVRGTLLPSAGMQAFQPPANAATPATVSASAIVAHAEVGAFWIAARGVYKAEAVGVDTALVSSRVGNDLATDGLNVYLASADGLFSYTTAAPEKVAAPGAFVKVVADTRSVIAVENRNGRRAIVDVHGGAAHPLAVTSDDVIAVTLAGDYVYYATSSVIRRVRR